MLGQVAETLHDDERAIYFYEQALRINSKSISALGSTAGIWRKNDKYEKAIEFFQRILNIDNTNGEVWGAIGHCQLMLDDLQKAYHSYQQALYYLPNPKVCVLSTYNPACRFSKDPKLWYGIGILYDRYGSFEHAEEAFTSVIGMDPDFDKANEIYFRLGIIYKQHQKYDTSLECFRYVSSNFQLEPFLDIYCITHRNHSPNTTYTFKSATCLSKRKNLTKQRQHMSVC